jgi:hypothetical protein
MTLPPIVVDVEGQTVGNAPTGFTQVDGSPTPTISTDFALTGTKSIKVHDAAVITQVRLTNFNSQETFYSRCFIYLPALPTTNELFCMTIGDKGGVARARFTVQTSGIPRIHSSTHATAGTVAVTAGTWIRAEIRCTPGTDAEARWWASPFSSDAPTDKMTCLSVGGENYGCTYGNTSSPFPTTPFDIYFENPAWSIDGWVGPDVNPFPRGIISPSYSDYPRFAMRM